jgi:hypothetical protein
LNFGNVETLAGFCGWILPRRRLEFSSNAFSPCWHGLLTGKLTGWSLLQPTIALDQPPFAPTQRPRPTDFNFQWDFVNQTDNPSPLEHFSIRKNVLPHIKFDLGSINKMPASALRLMVATKRGDDIDASSLLVAAGGVHS